MTSGSEYEGVSKNVALRVAEREPVRFTERISTRGTNLEIL